METMESLVARAGNGDQEAIKVLYEKSYKQVFYTIRSMVSDEDTALDLTQDTFIKAFSSLNNLGDPDKFIPWTKVIGRNLTLNYLKVKKPVLFSEVAPEGAEDDYELPFEDMNQEHMPEVVMDQNETRRLIREILGTLSESQRLAVGMFYYENLSVKEIAAQTGMSESSVKVHLHNGRKRIEEKVKELEKQGTKLFGFAPIPLLLLLYRMLSKTFSRETDPSAAALLNELSFSNAATGVNNAFSNSGSAKIAAGREVQTGAQSSKVQTGSTTNSSTVQTGSITKGSPAQSAERTVGASVRAAGTAGKAAAMGAGKIAAIIAACVVGAAAIAGGAIAGINAIHNNASTVETTNQIEVTTTENITTTEEPMTEISSETTEPESYPDSEFPDADEILSQIYADMTSGNYEEAATLMEDNRNTLWDMYTEAGYEGHDDEEDDRAVGTIDKEAHMYFIPGSGSLADLTGIETSDILGLVFMPDDGSGDEFLYMRIVSVKDGKFSYLYFRTPSADMPNQKLVVLTEATLDENSLKNVTGWSIWNSEKNLCRMFQLDEIELTVAHYTDRPEIVLYPYNGKSVRSYQKFSEQEVDVSFAEMLERRNSSEYSIVDCPFYYKDGAYDWDAMEANGGVFYVNGNIDDPDEFALSTDYQYAYDTYHGAIYYHQTTDGEPGYSFDWFAQEDRDNICVGSWDLPVIWEEMDAHVIR